MPCLRRRHSRLAIAAAAFSLVGLGAQAPTFLVSTPAAAASNPSYPTCLNAATTQVAMDQCVASEWRQAQAKLAKELKSEAKVYGKRQVSSAQKPWLTYEKAECSVEASLTKGGTAYGLNLQSCEVALINARIAQIQQLLAQNAAEAAAGSPAAKALSNATGSGATTDVTLPVVVCPTSDAVALTPSSVAVPSTRQVAAPSSLRGKLAVYSDSRNRMALVGPKGWSCSALFGADGSGGVLVSPPSESVSYNTVSSQDEVIVGGETSACVGCTLGQACPLFADAAVTYAQAGFPACAVKPVTESVLRLNNTVVAFDDPPRVKGDATPSGGPYTAHAVMTYNPQSQDGSWEDTCAVPVSLKAICTVSLNSFVAWYGRL